MMSWTSRRGPVSWGSPVLQISNWAWPPDRSCLHVSRWEQHVHFRESCVFIETVHLVDVTGKHNFNVFLSLQFPELHAMIMRRFTSKGDVDQAWQYVLQVRPLKFFFNKTGCMASSVMDAISFIYNTEALKSDWKRVQGTLILCVFCQPLWTKGDEVSFILMPCQKTTEQLFFFFRLLKSSSALCFQK